MVFAVKMAKYQAFGFSINSEIPFPELISRDPGAESFHVEIRIGDLSNLWIELSDGQNVFVVQENLVMFQASDVATFLIRDGKSIIVSPMGHMDEDKIRLYILGTCMGALLMQRKVLPLHGSAVAINGKAYAFVGERGAGKSTLAAAFLQKGNRLLSDDVIAVSLSKDNVPYVTPSYPQQKLWENSLNAFGMDRNQYSPLYKRETKYAVPVHSNYIDKPLPLAGVFELVKTDQAHITIHPIRGLEKLHTLYIHTFRQFLLKGLGLRDWHFNMTSRFANQIDMFRLQRMTSTFTADQLALLVLKTIDKENEG